MVAQPWGVGTSGLPTLQAVAPASAREVYVSGLQYSMSYRLSLSSCTASGLCSLVPEVIVAYTADWAPPVGLQATAVSFSRIQVGWVGREPSCDIAGNCWPSTLPYSVRWMGLGGPWHTLSASGGYVCTWGGWTCPGWSMQVSGLTADLTGLAPNSPYWIEISECAPGTTQCGRWSDPLKVTTLPLPAFSLR
jgi:hypothetical protein